MKNSEYDQKIPQSQTADKPIASLGRATQQSRDTRKTDKQSKATSSLFLTEMIAKLEWTQSNAQQNSLHKDSCGYPINKHLLQDLKCVQYPFSHFWNIILAEDIV